MANSTLTQPGRSETGTERSTTTIVVGVDGTEPSWSAFSWACGEARRLSGRVIAAYVTCATDPGLAAAALAGVDTGQYMLASEQTKAELAQRLESELHRIAVELGVRVDFLHLRGDTAEQLLSIARETHADILAVGRSANIRHRLAGSLSRRLTRERNAPIIVIVP